MVLAQLVSIIRCYVQSTDMTLHDLSMAQSNNHAVTYPRGYYHIDTSQEPIIPHTTTNANCMINTREQSHYCYHLKHTAHNKHRSSLRNGPNKSEFNEKLRAFKPLLATQLPNCLLNCLLNCQQLTPTAQDNDGRCMIIIICSFRMDCVVRTYMLYGAVVVQLCNKHTQQINILQ